MYVRTDGCIRDRRPIPSVVGQDLWDRSAMNRCVPRRQTMTTQLTPDRATCHWPRPIRLGGGTWKGGARPGANDRTPAATNTTPSGTINNWRFAADIAAESLAPLLFRGWNVQPSPHSIHPLVFFLSNKKLRCRREAARCFVSVCS